MHRPDRPVDGRVPRAGPPTERVECGPGRGRLQARPYAGRVPRFRLALAQVDTRVGDLAGNAATVREQARAASDAGADLLAMPELSLTGYPVEDLALRPAFVRASRDALAGLAADLAADGLGELPVVVGHLDAARPPDVGPAVWGQLRALPQNCVSVLHRGRVAVRSAKHHLPNYAVFDERRVFTAGGVAHVVRVAGVDVCLAVCEDIWQEGGPVPACAQAGAGLLLVVNASPYAAEKGETRLALVRHRAAQAGAVLAFVNRVGAQDDLVFDGQSLVVGPDGALLARSTQFAAELLLTDLDLPAGDPDAGDLPAADPCDPHSMAVVHHDLATTPRAAGDELPPSVASPLGAEEEVWTALVAGLRGYIRHNGFTSVIVPVSGGIDSSVVAVLAADAVGGEHVHGVALPSAYSSEHSLTDADDLARRNAMPYRVVSIAPMVDAVQDSMDFPGIAAENLQSRLRGVVVMGISNSEGRLLLSCGNKSEYAVGYSTIYGDACGGYAPIKDVPKTQVWSLARWRNKVAESLGRTPPIPENSISKPASAELAPGQQDTDSLPPYEVLDAVLAGYVDRDEDTEALVAAGFDRELVAKVVRLVDAAEWKRRQYPPGTRVSGKAFGRDRRLPITATHGPR